MRTKGFTLIELVVACTLLLLLSTVATTSTYNFVQATATLKAQYMNIQNIMALHSVLVNAKMNFAADLAQVSSNLQAEAVIQNWNQLAQGNDNQTLIGLLITPPRGMQPPLPLPPNSTGSYLPTSRNVPVITNDVNGNPVTTYVVKQITDMDSLLQAYQLTDDGKPTGNIVATISVGTLLEIPPNSGATTRPTLPIIDWKSGTPQEIQF